MSKSWNRIETWLTLGVLGVGGIILAIAGIWVYVSATAIPLHPSQQDVSSVPLTEPSSAWAGAAAEARERVRTGLAEQNLPGVSVAVGIGGDIVWAEGFGWANIEKREPVTPAHRFRIGNASIALTSAAVGVLLEEGRLSLDDAMQRHVPEFPQDKWPVTLRQLMAHVAGVRNDGGDEGPLFSQHCERPVEALQHFNGALRFEPGTEYRFSNYGWIVISAAVEAAADEPFLTFMQKEIFEPVGMNDTMADTEAQAVAADRATSYFPRFAADPRYGPDLMRPLDYSCYAGASVFLSTATDMVRFGMAINSGKLLQPATVQLLQTPQRLASGQETGYGLGWDVETVTLAGKQTHAIGHDGELLGGMATSLRTFPERGVVVSVLSNISYADTAGLVLKVAEVFAQQGNDRRGVSTSDHSRQRSAATR